MDEQIFCILSLNKYILKKIEPNFVNLPLIVDSLNSVCFLYKRVLILIWTLMNRLKLNSWTVSYLDTFVLIPRLYKLMDKRNQGLAVNHF